MIVVPHLITVSPIILEILQDGGKLIINPTLGRIPPPQLKIWNKSCRNIFRDEVVILIIQFIPRLAPVLVLILARIHFFDTNNQVQERDLRFNGSVRGSLALDYPFQHSYVSCVLPGKNK